jgi:hypothetical protein
MPSSKNYKKVEKVCLKCSKPLTLNNTRDIDRKKFCSKSCANSVSAKNRKPQIKSCDACGKMFSTQVRIQKFCSPECSAPQQIKRSYRMMHNNPAKYLQHALYKKGREVLTVDFMLDLLEKQGGFCALSGIKMTFTKQPGSGRINTNASIDQIEAGAGYIEENVQLVCDIVNRMKSDMTKKELKFWCRAILED